MRKNWTYKISLFFVKRFGQKNYQSNFSIFAKNFLLIVKALNKLIKKNAKSY